LKINKLKLKISNRIHDNKDTQKPVQLQQKIMQTQTSTNLFVDNRWDTSGTSEGTIKYLTEGSTTTPAICIKRWQNLEFMPFDELSAAQWMRHRNTIAGHFKPPVQSEEKKEPDNSLVTSLLETLSVVQRKQWLAKNPQYKEKICFECGCFNPTKKKCIHHDCPGMCETCFNKKNKTGFTKCACCGQKQEMTCPCCQEDFKPDDMVKGENCDHRICWACFGRSVKTSRPLSHCPMCRSVFCEKLQDSHQYDTDDEIPTLISDSEDDDYVEGDSWDFEVSNEVLASAGNLSDDDFDTFLTNLINTHGNSALAQAIRDGNVSITRGPLTI